ncbi:MAG: hypothetical protein K0R93_3530 [Anaerosolibacter sp.]|jgi:hypothetical protein|nr:hypothetical protein [Anaerosolibacter sp.]
MGGVTSYRVTPFVLDVVVEKHDVRSRLRSNKGGRERLFLSEDLKDQQKKGRMNLPFGYSTY